MARIEIPIVVDPRRIEQVVDFSHEVASVAHDLFVHGHTDHASRLRDALERLDDDGDG